jgi:hypothetical protein
VFSAAGSGSPRDRGAIFAPAELATIDPHPVQNHGQAPGDRNDGSTHPAPLGQLTDLRRRDSDRRQRADCGRPIGKGSTAANQDVF